MSLRPRSGEGVHTGERRMGDHQVGQLLLGGSNLPVQRGQLSPQLCPR
ncbi:hypothetical protein ABZ656_34070 [Streptomyces sp. NPDC007095]